jgi:hypothetical protein
MARYCWELFDKGGCHLTEREQEFIQDIMIARFTISEKQMRWLSYIYARCGRG